MKESLRFFVNGRYHEIAPRSPTTTVLDYLRDECRLTGTKEGCAEGDCGACTTVIAERHRESVRLRPVNACIQFLPTLDGRELITVEGLRDRRGELHPVQRALVECHGSQCGFCTPGFVMSLFALYKSTIRPDADDIRAALSGNLCRCTGYRPIVDAASRMFEFAGAADDDDWKSAPAGSVAGLHPGERDLYARLAGIRRDTMLSMGGAAAGSGHWFAPRTLDELAAVVAEHPDATLLAGGTDVGLWVTKQRRTLAKVVWLGEVEELGRVVRDDTALTIGAAVTLADAFAALVDEFPHLQEIARRFASPPICHSGTLVGNIANGSPIGDSMPALMCLGATLELRRADALRLMPLDEFYLGYRQSALAAGEFVSAVRVPRAEAGLELRSYKISKRFDQDISAVCGAFALQLDGAKVTRIDICFGGMAETPRRAATAERALLGTRLDDAAFDRAIDGAIAALAVDFSPISDMRASSRYRREAAASLLRLFLDDVAHDEPARVFELTSLPA